MKDRFEERKETFLSFQKLRHKRAGVVEKVKASGERIVTCRGCKRDYVQSAWRDNAFVCPSCGYHMTISGKLRLAMLLDEGSFCELYPNLVGDNPLDFPGYVDKLEKAREKRSQQDALYAGIGSIEDAKAVFAVLDPTFFMGSMGCAVGEKFALLTEYAIKERLPLVVFTASGGARMQEGLFSLMQMAKTSAAVQKMDKAGLLYVTVLTHPTTGGVSASFAMLGDVIFAEPGALIGFAGPRVIRQTIGEELPEGFQRSEFQKEHGFVDRIVERRNMREELGKILRLHESVRKGETGPGQEASRN